MEVFEFRLDNENVLCTFYKKSKLSKEAHGFKFGGQRVEDILKALGTKNVKSFKRINKSDMQINYWGGKVYLRNADKLLNRKAFAGIERKVENKAKRYGEKITAWKMKKHLEWRNNLRRKANRPKSVQNFSKQATFTKKEAYTFKFENNKPICTFSGTSKLINKKFSYTYDGQAASKTLEAVSKRNVTAFQLQRNAEDMEISTSKGNIYIEEYNRAKKQPSMKGLNKGIEKAADKMSQKEFKRRVKPLNKKTAILNKAKSALNFGKKVVIVGTFATILMVGAEKTGITSQALENLHDFRDAIATMAPADVGINLNDIKELSFTNNANTSEKDITLNFAERHDSDKLEYVQKNFSDEIEKYSKMYGLDPNLVTAIATQENGYNSDTTYKPAAGVMQIEKGVWAGKDIKAYNFETGQMETVVFSKNELNNVDNNIKAGCMILRRSLDANNNDIIYGVAGYNMGGGNMSTIMEEAAKKTGKSKEQIRKDYSWLKYTYAPDAGDPNYINNVMSYLPEGVDEVYAYGRDGTKHVVNITNTYEMSKTK